MGKGISRKTKSTLSTLKGGSPDRGGISRHETRNRHYCNLPIINASSRIFQCDYSVSSAQMMQTGNKFTDSKAKFIIKMIIRGGDNACSFEKVFPRQMSQGVTRGGKFRLITVLPATMVYRQGQKFIFSVIWCTFWVKSFYLGRTYIYLGRTYINLGRTYINIRPT